jgi:predicted TIM-barrel fold metal-dependent hydrolase
VNLIDTNAYLGHWATRRLNYNDGPGLLKLMDRAGIARACVSSASAIMYRNSQAGNEEMHDELTALASDRLIPFAVINPAYAEWEADLRWCVNEMGARGLRLYPAYHDYTFTDSCCRELMTAAGEAGLVVSVPQRVEDYRQRHWLIKAPDIDLAEYAALVKGHPQTNFLVTNAIGIVGSPFVTDRADMPANYWVDICRPDVVYGAEATTLVEVLGADRIVFGSGMPFNYPEAATVRLEILQAPADDISKIANGNIEALLT